ncbi:MAG: histidinol-phosphate transaminase [Dehalococcoidales bacterium]|nr:histidinol-phosphate transaminase [Dehalococcoidales bacterium]
MSEEGIEKFVRPDLKSFGGYAASKAPETLKGKVSVSVEEIIKLDANENPYGCSPKVQKAIADYSGIHVYPDSGQQELRRHLQDYTGVPMEHIVASAGSDQLIDLLMRLFVSKGDEVINCVPTFAMFQFFINLADGATVNVQRDENFMVDVKELKKAITPRTKLILLATPNNPTGTIMPKEDILEVLDIGLPTLVDEAYFEFTGETMAPLVGKYKNLMVLRTFSKWAGLAGLRIGYGMFPVEIANYLLRIKEPYCVNVIAQLAAIESVKDKDYLMEKVKIISSERDNLFNLLQQTGWLKPFPSKANFILCAVLKGRAKDIQQKLEEMGILVRYFDTPLLKDSLRISVGKPEENKMLVQALNKIGEAL